MMIATITTAVVVVAIGVLLTRKSEWMQGYEDAQQDVERLGITAAVDRMLHDSNSEQHSNSYYNGYQEFLESEQCKLSHYKWSKKQ